MIEALRYAFPRAMTKQERKHRRVIALRDRVAARPRLAAYLASERRLPFNLLDFILGTHPITTKGTTQVGRSEATKRL